MYSHKFCRPGSISAY